MLHKITFLLLVIGGINWLMVGAADMDIVMMLLGTGAAADAVYILVGVSALWQLITYWKKCTGSQSSSSPMM